MTIGGSWYVRAVEVKSVVRMRKSGSKKRKKYGGENSSATRGQATTGGKYRGWYVSRCPVQL